MILLDPSGLYCPNNIIWDGNDITQLMTTAPVHVATTRAAGPSTGHTVDIDVKRIADKFDDGLFTNYAKEEPLDFNLFPTDAETIVKV